MNDAKTRFTYLLRCILASLCVSSALFLTPASAEIYKWTDANGETQYSQIPPPSGIKSEVLHIQQITRVPPMTPCRNRSRS